MPPPAGDLVRILSRYNRIKPARMIKRARDHPADNSDSSLTIANDINVAFHRFLIEVTINGKQELVFIK